MCSQPKNQDGTPPMLQWIPLTLHSGKAMLLQMLWWMILHLVGRAAHIYPVIWLSQTKPRL